MRRSRLPQTRYGPADPEPERSDKPAATATHKLNAEPAAGAGRTAASSSGSAGDRILDREPRSTRRDKFSTGLLADAACVFSRRLGRDVSEDEARALLGDLADYYALAVDHAQVNNRAKQPSKRSE